VAFSVDNYTHGHEQNSDRIILFGILVYKAAYEDFSFIISYLIISFIWVYVLYNCYELECISVKCTSLQGVQFCTFYCVSYVWNVQKVKAPGKHQGKVSALSVNYSIYAPAPRNFAQSQWTLLASSSRKHKQRLNWRCRFLYISIYLVKYQFKRCSYISVDFLSESYES
jgi:hypothetical protein